MHANLAPTRGVPASLALKASGSKVISVDDSA
jgi:hypothetical protein